MGAINLDDLNEGFIIANPETFWVNTGTIHNHPDDMPHIMAALWQHESFRELSMEIWNEVFAPVAAGLLGENAVELENLKSIHEYEDIIRNSAKMEWMRWEIDFRHEEEVNFIIYFIERRFDFLNERWRYASQR